MKKQNNPDNSLPKFKQQDLAILGNLTRQWWTKFRHLQSVYYHCQLLSSSSIMMLKEREEDKGMRWSNRERWIYKLHLPSKTWYTGLHIVFARSQWFKPTEHNISDTPLCKSVLCKSYSFVAILFGTLRTSMKWLRLSQLSSQSVLQPQCTLTTFGCVKFGQTS